MGRVEFAQLALWSAIFVRLNEHMEHAEGAVVSTTGSRGSCPSAWDRATGRARSAEVQDPAAPAVRREAEEDRGSVTTRSVDAWGNRHRTKSILS